MTNRSKMRRTSAPSLASGRSCSANGMHPRSSAPIPVSHPTSTSEPSVCRIPAGATANAWFGKSKLSVVERYINKLMRTGKYTGKKQGATKAFEAALDGIHDRTADNPLQVFVDAIVHGCSDGGGSRAFDSAQSASRRPWMPHRADASTPPCATSRRVLNKGRPNPSDPLNNASSMRSSKPQMVM